MKMARILYVCILFILVSCGKTSLNAELGTPFKITSLESVQIKDTEIKLAGFKIIEDSRCPKNVNCFWEGQVVAAFDYKGSPLKFNSYKVLDTLGYSFKITAVEPMKIEGVDIPVADYILELLVTKYIQTASPTALE
jgi:hypothetical protein